jgi:hypothetical protein
MPRQRREFIEGGLYHVYNRFARGEAVFGDPEEAIGFVERLRRTKERDEFCVLACSRPETVLFGNLGVVCHGIAVGGAV